MPRPLPIPCAHGATGIREMSPIEMAYFDPDTQRFHVVRSTPVPLRVDAASTLPVSAVIDPSGKA